MPDDAPKRLTLEERLAKAAAAKKGSKKDKQPSNAKKGQEEPETKVDQESTLTNNIDSVEVTPIQSVSEDDQIVDCIIPDNYKDLSLKALNDKIKSIIDKRLKESIEDMKSKIPAQAAQPKNSNLESKLREKEKQIEELMSEGIELSKKELSLNQSIKRLKKHEVELENELEDYQAQMNTMTIKVEELESKISELSSIEKSHVEDNKQIDRLKQKVDTLTGANESLTDELKEYKLSKFDVQLEESNKELQTEKAKSAKIEFELNNLQKEFLQFKSVKLGLISSLESENTLLKSKIEENKSDSQKEIDRLEKKVENLRLQNETKQVSPTLKSKEIDMLQSQFDQAHENWKIIESSYLKKIQVIEHELEEIKSLNVTLVKKNKILLNDLKDKSKEIEIHQENELSLQSDIKRLKEVRSQDESSIEQLKLQLNELNKDYEAEKSNFESQLQKLQDQSAQNGNNFYMTDLASSSISFNKMPSNSFKRINSADYQKPPSFSQSSTRLNMSPFIPNTPHSLNRQSSIMSLDIDAPLGLQSNVFNADAPPLDALGVHAEDEDGIKMGEEALMDMSSDQLSTLPGQQRHSIMSNGNGNTQHIQLIKKLSSNVNRLEMELMNNKEELNKLVSERDQSSEEIMKLLDKVKSADRLEAELETKQEEVAKLEAKLDKALVLLGEKEERVEELSADVDDLKDLLKDQVQQMVEMQMKISN